MGKQIPLNCFWPWCNGRPWCKGKVQYHGSHVHLLERIEMAKTIQNCTSQGSNKRLLTHQSRIFANGDYCVKLRVTWIQRDFLQVPVEFGVISPKSRLNLELFSQFTYNFHRRHMNYVYFTYEIP